MMAYVGPENTRDNFDELIYQFQPKTKKLVRKFERILIKLYRQNVSLLFNQTCLNEGLLPTHTHAGYCWRSRDELISDVPQWTPTYGRAKAGRPARTYIQQLCEDTGCSLEDLPAAINDREKWRERVKDIRACGTT